MITKGRIIKGISGFYYVCDEHSRIFVCKARGIFRKDNIKPLVGDFVDIEINDEDKLEGNIVNIYDRTNTLLRPAVSNVDQALIIFSISNPSPSFLLLDKLLAYYNFQKIPVTVCFNKSDLSTKEDIENIKNIYKDADISIMFSSFKEEEGIAKIKSLLKNNTTVITGPSGVGKSTLTNILNPNANMETGNISTKLKRGKHTTRHAEIFVLEKNTYILDTPGFTSFDLEGIKPEELDEFYPDFVDYKENCKFLDCCHIRETECGVKKALNCGKINSDRYKNYILIFDELKKAHNRR